MPARAYAADNPLSLFSLGSSSLGRVWSLFVCDEVCVSFSDGDSSVHCGEALSTLEAFLPSCLIGWKRCISIFFGQTADLPDDVLYETSIILAFYLAIPLPFLPVKVRAWYSTLIGFVTVLLLGAEDVYHHLFLLFFTLVVCTLCRKSTYLGLSVFLFNFGYVSFVRSLDLIGSLPIRGTANMILLMAQLRFISIAYHIQDTQMRPFQNKKCITNNGNCEKTNKTEIIQHRTKDYVAKRNIVKINEINVLNIGVLDMIHTIYFFPGLWSGPILPVDVIQKTLTNPNTRKSRIFKIGLMKAIKAIPHFFGFIILPFFFPRDLIFTEWFKTRNIIMRNALIFLFIFERRARFVTAWMVAELTCLLGGAAYEETAHNHLNPKIVKTYDATLVEFYPSLKTLARNWNCTVQTWLVKHVYKRNSLKNTLLRKELVMVVSALWHGLDSGYFVTFVLFAIFQYGQECLWKKTWPYQANPYVAKFYIFVKWVLSIILVQFATTPFVFLSFDTYSQVWALQGYLGLYIFFLIVFLAAVHTGLYGTAKVFTKNPTCKQS